MLHLKVLAYPKLKIRFCIFPTAIIHWITVSVTMNYNSMMYPQVAIGFLV